jgi:uncharacterized protein YutE (UPF0331/DUF86 family)
VITNKTESIKRCIQRILEEYDGDEKNLHHFTKQDSIILNLQRACEASIDLAMHIVSEKRLGIPQNSRDAFNMLEEHQIIEKKINQSMKSMVGFRNVAVHDYQRVQIDIIQAIIDKHLNDFIDFTEHIKDQLK